MMMSQICENAAEWIMDVLDIMPLDGMNKTAVVLAVIFGAAFMIDVALDWLRLKLAAGRQAPMPRLRRFHGWRRVPVCSRRHLTFWVMRRDGTAHEETVPENRSFYDRFGRHQEYKLR